MGGNRQRRTVLCMQLETELNSGGAFTFTMRTDPASATLTVMSRRPSRSFGTTAVRIRL